MFEPVDQKANFPELERAVLAFWREADVFHRQLEQRRGGPLWIFYEGPPTANGQPGDPPHRVAHVQGRLPALPSDDGALRPAQGGVGLPRPPGRARGREGDRHQEQAGHRGVRRRGVQPAVPRVRPALRRRVRTPDRAPRLLDRHRRRLLDDGPGLHRERVVVAQATPRQGPAVPGRPDHDVLPAMRDAAVRRRGGDGVRRRRGPERLRQVHGRRVTGSRARGRPSPRVDDDAVDVDLQHRASRLPRDATYVMVEQRGRALRPRGGTARTTCLPDARPVGRPFDGSHARRDPGTSRCTRTSRAPTAWWQPTSSRSRTAPAWSTWRRRSVPRTSRSAGARGGRRSSRSTARAGSPTRRRRSSAARSSRRPTRPIIAGPAFARAAAAGRDARPRVSPVLAVRHAADLHREELLVRADDRGQGPAARGERGGRLVPGPHQARPLRRLAPEQRRLGALARTLLGHPVADLAVRAGTRHGDRIVDRALRARGPRRHRARPAPARASTR